MASNYTVNTGIEKPDTGDQSGTWGETTNVNFDIIDRAISGVGSIPLTGLTAKTLTTTDGALSEGGYRVLIFTGSPGGTSTVTIDPPDQEKFYVVFNNTDESIVLTQGSGGNVTILTGNTKVVYADGEGASAKVSEVGATMPVGGATVTELGYLSGVTSAIQTQLNTLTTNVAQFLPAGTKMLFQQTSAPTGWTKETSNFDNSAIRVTTGNTGSGGTVDFTTLFTGNVAGTIATSVSGTVAGHALQISQMPAHRHFVFRNEIGNLDGGPGNVNTGNFACFANNSFGGGDEKYSIVATGNEANVSLSSSTGSTQNHSHGWSGTATSTFSNGNDLAVKYVDVIIATKD